MHSGFFQLMSQIITTFYDIESNTAFNNGFNAGVGFI